MTCEDISEEAKEHSFLEIVDNLLDSLTILSCFIMLALNVLEWLAMYYIIQT